MDRCFFYVFGHIIYFGGSMLKRLSDFMDYVKTRREIQNRLDFLTTILPCVNLSMKKSFARKIKIYNNSDLIAVFEYYQLKKIVALGWGLFDAIIYYYCIKYSIEYF